MSDNEAKTLDIYQVLKYLPHRYPFLLIDRVLDYEAGVSLRALKNVTVNEPFFMGHFPERPIMPGVLILEAMAQATGVLAFVSGRIRSSSRTVYYFVGVDKARFRRPVGPGDQMILDVQLKRSIRGVWKFAAEASVDGDMVACADLMTAVRDFEP